MTLQRDLERLGKGILAVGVLPSYAVLCCVWGFQGCEKGKVYSLCDGIEEFVNRGGKRLSKIVLSKYN